MKRIKVDAVLFQHIVIFFIVILSLVYFRYNWVLNKNEQLNDLLRIAGSIEATLPKDDIKALEAKPGDIDKPQYHIIKDKLKAIIHVNSDARFAYLLVERNNKVYFLADSESVDSKDYSPPGQEYVDANIDLLQFFKDGKGLVTETFTDHWGKWKSVLVPIKDGVTGKTIAVFGMDFSANAWNKRLYYEMVESSVLMMLLLSVLFFILKIQSKNKLLKRDITERRQAEEELLKIKNQYSDLVANIPVGVYIMHSTPEGVLSFKYISPKAAEMFNVSVKDFMANLHEGFKSIHPDDIQSLVKLNQDSYQHPQPFKWVGRAVINGKIKWLQIESLPDPQPNGDAIWNGIIVDITGRKQAEEALQFRNVLLGTQQEALIEGILVVDSDNNIISYNHRFIEMWGIPTELIEKNDDEPVLRYATNQVVNSQSFLQQVQYLYEHKELTSKDEIVLKSGSIFDRYSAPMVGPNNLYYGRIWSFHDITEHKHAERMLRQQSNAMEATIDGLAILNADLNYIYINNAHAKIYGYNNSDELLGASWCTLYDTSELQRFELEIMPGFNRKGYYHGRANGRKKDGSTFPQDISLTTLEDGGLICVVRDITNQIAVEDELINAKVNAEKLLLETQKQNAEIELQNERLESLLRITQYKPTSRQDLLDCALNEAIKLTLSKIGYISYYNESSRQITFNTWSNEVMREYAVSDPQTIYDLDKTGCWGEAIRQRKPILINNFQEENPFKKGTPPGHVHLSNFLTIPIFIDNTIVALIGVANKPEDYQLSDIRQLTLLMDAVWRISERENMIENLKIAKDHAEESDRLKSAFLANMSHEIRTPMNGILGFAGLLKEPKLTGEEQLEYIGIIEKSGARMLNIINDIMSISKVESGQMEVSVKETNINEQIEYIYTFFKPEAEKKGIQLSIKKLLSGGKAIIKTDKEKVYAILTNLVKNAIKFTQSGSIEFGYILKSGRDKACLVSTTGLVSTTNELEFYVKDTGSGIRQDQQQFIFDRFRQGSESLTRNYEGAGLGLAISKAYVEMLGGKIRVESKEGRGSVFYFTLPYNKEQEDISTIENIDSEIDASFPVKSLKILIAEDDESSNRLIKISVSTFASEIFSVKTGVAAVEVCRKNPDIDLVLMDIKMPEMDGYEATTQIRKFNPDVIIIAQTAFALYGDSEKAIAAGCNDYISKPIEKSVLVSLLNKHFEIKEKK